MWNIIYGLILLYTLPACAQNNGNLYTTPADSPNGSFVFPRTFPLTFREGSSINISWTTEFDSVNLFYYQRGKVANSIQLATNQAISWYQWQVASDEKDLTEPFVFRAVKAQGTLEDQTGGGFWSTSYYISRNAADESSSSKPSAATTSQSASPSPTSSQISSKSEQALSSTQSPASVQPSQEPTQSTVPLEPQPLSKSIITGLTVGLVLAFALILAGLGYLCYRRRRRRNVASVGQSVPTYPVTEETKGDHVTNISHEIYVSPAEMEGSQTFHELSTAHATPRPDKQGDVWSRHRI